MGHVSVVLQLFVMTNDCFCSGLFHLILSLIPPSVLRVVNLLGFCSGLFHLILSLIPPSVLRVVNLLGFHGNRYLGLTSLNTVASSSGEYRSILARLVFILYLFQSVLVILHCVMTCNNLK